MKKLSNTNFVKCNKLLIILYIKSITIKRSLNYYCRKLLDIQFQKNNKINRIKQKMLLENLSNI